ncbi:hypothetical protein CR513_41883, partial [Mucuna pruriens]
MTSSIPFVLKANDLRVKEEWWVLIGTLHFANIAISYRVGRVGPILSAVEGAAPLHLLGYFDPFLSFLS